MKLTLRRMMCLALFLAFSLTGCNSDQGVGVATAEDAATDAKAAAENPDAGKSAPKRKRPAIKAEGSAASLKLDN